MVHFFKRIFPFFIVFAITSFAIWPLFHSGFFTIHDDEQIGRLYEMIKVISQGQIPPRWVPDLGFGYGYPLFNFYPPLVYYLGAILHVVGFSLIYATKIVMGLGFVGAALGMFVWIRKYFGTISALFAALLYTYAPYHSVDIYVRGALSEFFAWIWIPFIFWSIDMLFETLEKKYVLLFAVFFAGLMLSHTLVMLQFAPIFLLYLPFSFLRTKGKSVKKVLFFTFALVLGLMLPAYFWLPSLLEKQYTLVDSILTRELANYAIHFVCPIQLWSSPWGYGGSVAGCVDGLSFQIGKIQILVAALGTIVSTFALKKKKIFPFVGVVVFLFSVFMTLSYSSFIWNMLKPFWYIQFPWRYLLFVAVGCAFLGGYLIHYLQRRVGTSIALIVMIILSATSLFQIRNYFRPQEYLQKTDTDFTSNHDLQWRVSSMSYEYVPKQVATRLSKESTTELAIDIPANLVSSRSYVAPAGMDVQELQNTSQLKKYRVSIYNTKTRTKSVFQVNSFDFPGWKVFVNGKEFTDRVVNRLHLIQIALPPGSYEVVVQFGNTPIRSSSDVISLIGWLVVLAMLGIAVKKHTI